LLDPKGKKSMDTLMVLLTFVIFIVMLPTSAIDTWDLIDKLKRYFRRRK